MFKYTARNFMQHGTRRAFTPSQTKLYFQPKRQFTQGFDRLLSNFYGKYPFGIAGKLFTGINIGFYLLYLLWPKDRLYSFLNNFTFSKYNISQGKLHTLLTCHFTHMETFQFILDTGILYLFFRNIEMMHGPVFLTKLALLSMLIGSTFLYLQHVNTPNTRLFYGSDSILRAMIFTIIFQNPTATFMLFPLPIPVPAWAIAALVLLIDFTTMNVAGFGGIAASYLMLNFL